MNNLETFFSVQDAYVHCLKNVLDNGASAAPRGIRTYEILGTSFRIANPRNRLINIPLRKWKIHYAFGELLWHLSGSRAKSFIRYYSKFWEKYYVGELTVEGSSYGRKLFVECDNGIPWTKIKELILKDPDTRRAIIPLFLSNDFNSIDKCKDVACCCMMQFLVRNNKINLICSMRSNDAFLGLSYDLFLFSMLLELMSIETGYELGWYQHNIASLHLYETDCRKARDIINSEVRLPREMPSMDNIEEIPLVVEYERKIRECEQWTGGFKFDVSRYWKDILDCLVVYKVAKCLHAKEIYPILAVLENNPYTEWLTCSFENILASG